MRVCHSLRTWSFVCALTMLASCASPTPAPIQDADVEPQPPPADCDHVPVSPIVGRFATETELFHVISKLACFYGVRVARQIADCSTKTYPNDYLEGKSPDFGLKKASRDRLYQAYVYGLNAQGKVDDWDIEHGHSRENLKMCLESLHETPDAYEELAKATRGLVKFGF